MNIQLSDHFNYRRLLRFTFPSIIMMIFPLFFGIDGIWLSIVAAEVVAAAVTLVFLAAKKKKYHY